MLHDLGLDFEVLPAEVDETEQPGESPEEFVQRLAIEKAMEISNRHPEAWALGADTIVVYEGDILGKPNDAKDALAVLMRLSGQMHRVYTGFSLLREHDNISVSRVIGTEVFFTSFSKETANAYVATGEPLDKAGAYGIQGRGGALVEKINGSYSNVVGLPLAETIEALLHYEIIQPF